MAAEAELNALKKLESNKSCVNCDAYNKFGHGNVCDKFKTFVCSNCKSAHQSFSMRVKSVTMSNWTKDEVDALREENGGGNAVAKRVWLGRWDESRLRKPRDGDHVDVYKRFIDKVYNDRAFYDEDAAVNPTAKRTSSVRSMNGYSAPAPAPVAAAPAPNLLDFGSPTASAATAQAPTFDAFASPPKGANDAWGAYVSAPAPVVAPAASNGFSDGFGAFMSAPAAPANPMAAFDPFGASSSAPAPSAPASVPAPASTPSFDPFGSTSVAPMPAPPSAVSFDPFAPNAAHHAPPSSSGGFGFGGNGAPMVPMAAPPSGNFSAFDALSGPPQGMGMNMGMGGGMPRGPGTMNGGMGMNMGMQPGMMMGGGAPRPMVGGGYTMPPAQGGAYGGLNRPGGRDPFAGLGLPGK